MERVVAHLRAHARSGATIGPLAAKSKESCRVNHGFGIRPNERLGKGRCQFVKDEG